MSNKTVKVEEFSEESFWVIDCPFCKETIETQEEPDYVDSLICDNCNNIIYVEH